MPYILDLDNSNQIKNLLEIAEFFKDDPDFYKKILKKIKKSILISKGKILVSDINEIPIDKISPENSITSYLNQLNHSHLVYDKKCEKKN